MVIASLSPTVHPGGEPVLVLDPYRQGVAHDGRTGQQGSRPLTLLRLLQPLLPSDDHLMLSQRGEHLLDDAVHDACPAVVCLLELGRRDPGQGLRGQRLSSLQARKAI